MAQHVALFINRVSQAILTWKCFTFDTACLLNLFQEHFIHTSGPHKTKLPMRQGPLSLINLVKLLLLRAGIESNPGPLSAGATSDGEDRIKPNPGSTSAGDTSNRGELVTLPDSQKGIKSVNIQNKTFYGSILIPMPNRLSGYSILK